MPALLLEYQLRKYGFLTDVLVLENLFSPERKLEIRNNKTAFHNKFSVALMGQRIARNLRTAMEERLVHELLESWRKKNRKNFIIFSGFWIPIVDEYRAMVSSHDINVDLCHMDAVVSTSWKLFARETEKYNHIFLFNGIEKRIQHTIHITNEQPIPYNERVNRYVIHGGGWGIGTYQEKIAIIQENKIPLNIIVYDYSEVDNKKNGNRYFMTDPTWNPWDRNENGKHTFPPFARIKADETPNYRYRESHHEFFNIMKECKAVISKPGGATLLDSLESATPIVLLEPFGFYERENAELWIRLGLGISYDKWEQTGFSENLLEECHQNLLKEKNNTVAYSDTYCRNKGNNY